MISKEEAKKQFDYYTKALNLKHTFTFDEVYDQLLAKRQEKFRSDIMCFEEHLKTLPGTFGADPFPLKHTFAGGLYIRELRCPANTLTVTKIHKQEHAFFLMKGTISILTPEGVRKYTAPYQGITKPGTKRIIWHHDEVVFITVHATDKKTVEEVEQQVIANNFDEIDELEDSTKIRDFIDLVAKEDVCHLLQQQQ